MGQDLCDSIPVPGGAMACGKTQKPADASKLRWSVGGRLTKLSAEPLDFQLKSCPYPKPPRIRRPVPH